MSATADWLRSGSLCFGVVAVAHLFAKQNDLAAFAAIVSSVFMWLAYLETK